MPAKPFRRSVVSLLVLTLACLVPASAFAAGPRDPGARVERGADLPRPVTGFWALVFVVVERATAVFAAATGDGTSPIPVQPSSGEKGESGATLDPSGSN